MQLTIIQKKIVKVFAICAGLLVLPLMGQLFVDGWNLTPMDFTFAFVMWSATGIAYVFSTRNVTDITKRMIIGACLFVILATIWGLLATG